MMKLSFECEVPSLSQAEPDALGKVVRDAISKFLFLQIGKPFTDERSYFVERDAHKRVRRKVMSDTNGFKVIKAPVDHRPGPNGTFYKDLAEVTPCRKNGFLVCRKPSKNARWKTSNCWT